MPYIELLRRSQITLEGHQPDSPGELNYAITNLLVQYWENNHRYQSINDIVGALECAKLEFYRRVATPYEQHKCEVNGDVYR